MMFFLLRMLYKKESRHVWDNYEAGSNPTWPSLNTSPEKAIVGAPTVLPRGVTIETWRSLAEHSEKPEWMSAYWASVAKESFEPTARKRKRMR